MAQRTMLRTVASQSSMLNRFGALVRERIVRAAEERDLWQECGEESVKIYCYLGIGPQITVENTCEDVLACVCEQMDAMRGICAVEYEGESEASRAAVRRGLDGERARHHLAPLAVDALRGRTYAIVVTCVV